jgi:hypothetical protein
MKKQGQWPKIYFNYAAQITHERTYSSSAVHTDIFVRSWYNPPHQPIHPLMGSLKIRM